MLGEVLGGRFWGRSGADLGPKFALQRNSPHACANVRAMFHRIAPPPPRRVVCARPRLEAAAECTAEATEARKEAPSNAAARGRRKASLREKEETERSAPRPPPPRSTPQGARAVTASRSRPEFRRAP